jgi:GNAT superfamily N-acetyltransferase
VIRPAGPQDVRFLRDMLRHAYFWRMGREVEDPVYRYVRNWGRRGDFGLVALADGNLVGAAWYRLFREAEPGFGFVDEATPELTLAVVPARRGQGFGHELLEGLLARAREDALPAISLSAPKGATALYERYGFRAHHEADGTVTMLASLGSTENEGE